MTIDAQPNLSSSPEQSPPATPLRIAVAGLGETGAQVLERFAAEPGVVVPAVAEPDEALWSAAFSEHGVPIYTTVRELLYARRYTPFDALVVCLPPRLQVIGNRLALLAGVHVLGTAAPPQGHDVAAALLAAATKQQISHLLMVAPDRIGDDATHPTIEAGIAVFLACLRGTTPWPAPPAWLAD